MAAILYALSAALSWGVGDFSSGLAARRVGPAHTLLLSFCAGVLSLVGLALLTGEPFPASRDVWLGSLAGFVGLGGFLSMLYGFTVGRISIVSPVSALLAAAVPVLFTALIEGLPKPLQLSGFGLAFLSIWLLSRRNETASGPSGILPALLAGLGFGVFFILVGQLPPGTLFWPLVVGRLVAIALLAAYFMSRRQVLLPVKAPLGLLALAGVLDALGNLFFVLSVQAGRLDIASVLVSLGPAVTVLLARVIVKEHLTRWQVLGVLLAISATVLVSL